MNIEYIFFDGPNILATKGIPVERFREVGNPPVPSHRPSFRRPTLSPIPPLSHRHSAPVTSHTLTTLLPFCLRRRPSSPCASPPPPGRGFLKARGTPPHLKRHGGIQSLGCFFPLASPRRCQGRGEWEVVRGYCPTEVFGSQLPSEGYLRPVSWHHFFTSLLRRWPSLFFLTKLAATFRGGGGRGYTPPEYIIRGHKAAGT